MCSIFSVSGLEAERRIQNALKKALTQGQPTLENVTEFVSTLTLAKTSSNPTGTIYEKKNVIQDRLRDVLGLMARGEPITVKPTLENPAEKFDMEGTTPRALGADEMN